MSKTEFKRLLGFHLASIHAPRCNKISRRKAKGKQDGYVTGYGSRGRFISIRGFARI